MKKADLIAQLEGAKALTSVVSIDNVIALLHQLEEPKLVGSALFETVMELVERAVDDMRNTEIADGESAEFELNYNNQIELTNVEINRDAIVDAISSELDMALNVTEEEEQIDLQVAAE